jgi:hypothetical protein
MDIPKSSQYKDRRDVKYLIAYHAGQSGSRAVPKTLWKECQERGFLRFFRYFEEAEKIDIIA